MLIERVLAVSTPSNGNNNEVRSGEMHFLYMHNANSELNYQKVGGSMNMSHFANVTSLSDSSAYILKVSVKLLIKNL